MLKINSFSITQQKTSWIYLDIAELQRTLAERGEKGLQTGAIIGYGSCYKLTKFQQYLWL